MKSRMTAAWGFEEGSASPSPSSVKLSQGAGTQGHLFLTVLPPQAHWSHTDLGVASSQHSKLSHGNSSLAQGHKVTQASISPMAVSWNSSVHHIDCGKTYFSEILCARQLRLARHEWELFCKGTSARWLGPNYLEFFQISNHLKASLSSLQKGTILSESNWI